MSTAEVKKLEAARNAKVSLGNVTIKILNGESITDSTVRQAIDIILFDGAQEGATKDRIAARKSVQIKLTSEELFNLDEGELRAAVEACGDMDANEKYSKLSSIKTVSDINEDPIRITALALSVLEPAEKE